MKKKIKRVAVIIPTHKSNLSEDDYISIKQLQKTLPKFDKYFVIPERVSEKNFPKKDFMFRKVPNKYFGTLARFKSFFLSEYFYKRFEDYEYVLVYQLDALVFSDQLLYWCNKNYDFIGAPWLNSIIGFFSHKKGYPTNVGNGGFCLRKVETALKVLEKANELAKRNTKSVFKQRMWFIWAVLTGKSHGIWMDCLPDNYPFNEDGFWAFEAPKYFPDYKLPNFKDSLKFAFEKSPRKCFELNNNKLPFGAHAWERYDKSFWEKFILK